MEEEKEKDPSPELPSWSTAVQELEGGIFNMVIALAQSYAHVMAPEEARERTAVWLESIVTGLRMKEDYPQNGVQ